METSKMTTIINLLEKAKKAALQAGEAILEVYNAKEFDVTTKGDQSPLTQADTAAHAIIVSTLHTTGLPVLSEEGSQTPYEERKHWNRFWLVDPLDGTKEFIKRNGEFTVNIALIQDHMPVAGVIYAPYLDVLYYGAGGAGAIKIEKGRQTALPSAPNRKTLEELQRQDRIMIVASKSHLNEETQAFINRFSQAQLTSMGSSLKLMLVAEGAADIYPRLAPTMEWDIAAGHALLSALNKGVYQTDLKTELVYNKESLLNPSFIVF